MAFPVALLENWMREYYFSADIDIGSSGVEDFSMSDLRRRLGFSYEQIDGIVFHDSRTLGALGLREAIAERWTNGEVGRVMATHGSTEATFLVMNALLGPGDEVVVSAPCYQQLQSNAASLGCRLRHWPLRFEQGFRPDLNELARLLGPRTRMVVVNFPHNPTGVSLSPAEQRELIATVANVGAYLVWDNAFAELTHGAPPLPEPSLLYERAYGLPGLRVGWCLAAAEVLARLVQIRDYVTLHLSPLVEFIAERAIRRLDLLIEPRLEQAQRNLGLLCAFMRDHEDLVSWVPPDGGVTVFPRLEGFAETEPFCRRLADERRVLVVPGNCFEQPGHVRLGFGGPAHTFQLGVQHIAEMLRH
jgi:capreomycidine synthase